MRTILFLLLILPMTVFADIAVTLPADSSVDSSSGVSSFGKWSDSNGGFQISWNISQVDKGSYSYIYTISDSSGKDLSKGVNSFVLELNTSITPKNLSSVITDSSVSIIAGPTTFTPGSSGLTALPGDIYGIQFDTKGAGVATISFTSTNAPVWGSFYADNGITKGKDKGYAYNAAFGSNPESGTKDFSNWVPTVGGPSVLAPEPSTMLILGSTLVAAAYFSKRRKIQNS